MASMSAPGDFVETQGTLLSSVGASTMCMYCGVAEMLTSAAVSGGGEASAGFALLSPAHAAKHSSVNAKGR